MEPELIRSYKPTGVNGKIQYQNRSMMYSIELPWKENPAQVSRIPEGRYEGIKRWSPKFSRHLPMMNVSQRENILIHLANDATHERKGCIALVFNNQSRLGRDDHVFIIINEILMNLFKRAVSPTPTFFQRLRNIGLSVAAVSAAIVSAPVAIPGIVTTIAGYLALAGTVLSGVSQITIPEDK